RANNRINGLRMNFFLYYTHDLNPTLTGNIKLISAGEMSGSAYNITIVLFMQFEVVEQHNALEYVRKRIFFIYFSDKSPVTQLSSVICNFCVINNLQLVEYHIERAIVENIVVIFIFLEMQDTGRFFIDKDIARRKVVFVLIVPGRRIKNLPHYPSFMQYYFRNGIRIVRVHRKSRTQNCDQNGIAIHRKGFGDVPRDVECSFTF